MLHRSVAVIALFALATCSTKSSDTPGCPGCAQPLEIRYSGQFFTGSRPPPVEFSSTGQTATVSVRTFAVANRAETTAWFPTPCPAVRIRSVRPGEVQLEASARGACTLDVSAGGIPASLAVSVQ